MQRQEWRSWAGPWVTTPFLRKPLMPRYVQMLLFQGLHNGSIKMQL